MDYRIPITITITFYYPSHHKFRNSNNYSPLSTKDRDNQRHKNINFHVMDCQITDGDHQLLIEISTLLYYWCEKTAVVKLVYSIINNYQVSLCKPLHYLKHLQIRVSVFIVWALEIFIRVTVQFALLNIRSDSGKKASRSASSHHMFHFNNIIYMFHTNYNDSGPKMAKLYCGSIPAMRIQSCRHR